MTSSFALGSVVVFADKFSKVRTAQGHDSTRFSALLKRTAFLISFVCLEWSQGVFAGELCIRALHSPLSVISVASAQYYDQVLKETESFHRDELLLQAVTNSRLKEKFKISSHLPLDGHAYANARFVLTGQTQKPKPTETRISNVEFGYVVSDSFKRIGTLQSVIVDERGRVVEVEGGSQELLDEFKSQVLGRVLSSDEKHTLSEINLKLIDYLRGISDYKKKVGEFALSRGWPVGLADEARLAYCDRDISVLTKWADKNGYTLKQLRDAGWLKLSFDREGKPRYAVWASGIRIPFFSDERQSGIVGWRTRVLEAPTPDFPKYLSELKDRSIEADVSLNEWFYGVWNVTEPLERLVITEGEFKSLVATRLASVPTLGMLGITNYTPDLLKALVKLPVKEFVIIFDRDADGKGLMRANGVTDSQRGAYQLAIDLRDAGAKNVKIGILPDAFGDGRKVGIDDLILAKGAEPYRQVVAAALKPEEFAQEMGLETRFQEIHHRKQALRRALDQYENALKRGGARIDSAVLNDARSILGRLEEAHRRYLKQQLDVKSIYEPSARFNFIPPPRGGQRDRSFNARTASGKSIRREDFGSQMVLMDFMVSDASDELIDGDKTVEFPFTRRQLKDGFYENGLRDSEEYVKGVGFAQKAGLKVNSFDRFKAVMLAGYLAHTFPADEYVFEFEVVVQRKDPSDGRMIIERIPLMIRKKDGTVVAMAELHSPAAGKATRGLSRIKEVIRAR